MVKAPAKLTFLERAGYRRRRMRDVARVLPLIGALLFCVPLLWPRKSPYGPGTADAMIYLFVVWSVLIGLNALLTRYLGQDADHKTETQ